ncbi:MAG: molybdopterin molybdotransferase MoeA [Bacteroidales bacterium]
MISFQEALNIILKNTQLLDKVSVPLTDAYHRVLAEDIVADVDMPAFNKSAVDGFACKNPDEGIRLKVRETISAGSNPGYPIDEGYCSKIMTGAQVPEGANWVVMVENTSVTEEGLVQVLKKGKKSNIVTKAEDFTQGDQIVSAGTFLKPQHIPILASVGTVTPEVYDMPSVSLITTGDELVEPDAKPRLGKLRNTNASQLTAQFNSMGIRPSYQGIISDEEHNLLEVIKRSVNHYDLTVLTGGVSMGDYDYVPGMMEKAGVEILFHNIAMKPGKPTIFGKYKDHLVIGLPGNPVSTFLQFELLIKPMVIKMMGGRYKTSQISLPAGEYIKSKKEERDSWKPVYIENAKVYSLPYHGSGHFYALNKAEGFICIPGQREKIEKGDLVDVRQI